jgi:biopolymer transport protein ExbD
MEGTMTMMVSAEIRRKIPREVDLVPVLDLVLVLLIVFMVVLPLLMTSFWGHRAPNLEKEEVIHGRLQADTEPPMILRVQSRPLHRVEGISDRIR